jgi:hypothetical protein
MKYVMVYSIQLQLRRLRQKYRKAKLKVIINIPSILFCFLNDLLKWHKYEFVLLCINKINHK